MLKWKKLVTSAVVTIFIVIVSANLIWLRIKNKETLPTVAEVSQAINSEFSELIWYNSEETSTPILDALHSGFSVRINSISASETDENVFDVACVLENYDVSEAYASVGVQTQDMKVEDFCQLFAQQLTQSRRLAKKYTIKVTKNEKGIYSVAFTEESLDTAMGGFISYFDTFLLEENSNERVY